MKKLKAVLTIIFLVAILAGCQDQSKPAAQKKERVVVAKLRTPVQRLYYSGVLEPITMRSILSPVAGRVAKINFTYGQPITEGQTLFQIDSTELAQDYRKSISDYLQKKSAYFNGSEDFRGSKALYNAGVISRQAYVTSRTQYRNNQLNYYQSQYAMEKILVKAGIDPRDIESLTLEDAGKVNKILQRQFKKISIPSTANGIALFPIHSQAGSSDDDKKVELGASVKQGQLLLTVGDLSGLSLKIHVNEVNIGRFHKGMKAIVTGSAFPNIKLNAYVASVSSQAKEEQSNTALSEFPVLIKVPELTEAQRKQIRVGMTAKVAIVVNQQKMIMLPVAAVYTKNGLPMVTVIKDGHHASVPVTIGFTTPTEVSIASGVKPGDKILVSEESQ